MLIQKKNQSIQSNPQPSMTIFEKECETISNEARYIVLRDVHHQRVTVVLEHEGSCVAEKARKIITARHWCNTCSARMKRFLRYSNEEDHVFFPTQTPDSPLRLLVKSIMTTTRIAGVHVLTGEYVDGHEPIVGGFTHYYGKISEDKQTEVSDDTALLYEKAFQHYLPSIIPNLLSSIFPVHNKKEEAVETMRKSLDLVAACILQSVYGNRMDESVKWLRRIVDYYDAIGCLPYQRTVKQRWMDGASFLLWTNLSKNGDSGVVSPIVQQTINNLLDLMTVAHNEKAMIAMITERFRPDNYQRPSTTKALSMGSIENAIRSLGSFENTIMTQEEAAELPHTVVVKRTVTATVTDSATGFAAMKAATKNEKRSPADFSRRCFPTSMRITTVNELLKFVEDTPTVRVEVETNGMTPVYVAKTTLPSDRLSVPHLWAFLCGKTPIMYGMKAWENVSMMVPIFRYIPKYNSVFFVVEDLGLNRVLGNTQKNCCFPEFLSTQYTRTCRDAFERLNVTTPIKIPSTSALAFGVGISATNSHGDLNKPVKIRIDGGPVMTIHQL